MLRVINGDITTAASGLILQQVNCQGVMGSGVAKALRDKWPVVYDRYSKRYIASENGGGADLLGEAQFIQVEEDLWVCNLFGQQYYGRTGAKFTSYDALDTALRRTKRWLDDNATKIPVHYPTIGCGLGGGNWDVVQCLIQQHIGEYEQTLWLQ